MWQPAPFQSSLTRMAAGLSPRAPLLALGGAGLLPFAWAWPDPAAGLLIACTGGTFLAGAGALRLLGRRAARAAAAVTARITDFIAEDATPSLAADAEGRVSFQNRAARERFGSREGADLARLLAEVFANPAVVIARMQNRAAATGSAREDMVTRRGHVRIAVHRVGGEGYLWRLEDLSDRAGTGRAGDAISLPMLTVSRSDTVLYMNEAMRRLVGERVRSLDRIFADLPLRPGEEHDILTADGPTRALVAALETTAGRREVFLLPAPGVARGENPRDLEALPVALVRVTAAGILAEANRMARALLGQATIGAPFSEALEGLGRPVQDWLDDALAGRAERRPEVLRVRHADGESYLHVTLSRVIEDGRPGLVGVLTDATQLKTLEAQFVQSQKMQAIGQLAGGIAHDFNNLLTAISGHCDLLLLRHDRGDPDYGDLVQINQNANRAASLVSQLLAYSRKQTLKPKVIDLRDTMSDLTHLLNRLVGERINLDLRHDAGLRPIRADKRQLEQVIMNLVVNARDAMPEGGTIRIVTENLRLAEPFCRDRATVAPGDYVAVRVIDTGSGIPADRLDKIFEPFFTTKKQGEGTGLGLSTAYGIVKQTGGFIFCDSAEGKGTTFTLLFPAHDRVEEDAAEPETPPQRRAARPTEGVVLLVEDEAPVRAFASRALRLRGFTVIEAENAEQALDLLRDPSLAVDVFVTDVIMPGLDGPSWVREALKDRPDARVVFVSGYSEESLTESRERIPNAVFLQKPFSLGELTATVQNQFH